MITQIVLKDYRAIDHLTLSELSKCNVFCGKNNSGKTTILKAINQAKNRSLYISLSPQDIVRILKLSAGPNSGFKAIYPPSFVKEYAKMIEGSTLSDGTVNSLVTTASNAWKQAPLRPAAFQGEKLKRGMVNFLQNYPTIYLSSWRIPAVSDTKSCEKIPNANGQHLTPYLSMLKNSEEPSCEKRIWNELKYLFKYVSGGYDFDVTINSENEHWYVKYRAPYSASQWFGADQSGRGLSYVLFTLCFTILLDYCAILIDEPEMHVHPEMQKRLQQVMMDSGKQLFYSTHANTFINPSDKTSVFLLTNAGKIEVTPITSKAIALSDLGYSISDNLVSDLIVLVEGSNDKPIIEWLVDQILGGKYSVKVWPLGGNNMEHVDLEVFTESCEVIAIVDKDPGSQDSRDRFEKKCRAAGVPFLKLERYAAENYFTMDAIRSVFGTLVPDGITSIPEDIKVKESLGFSVKSRIREILAHMTLTDIEGTDLYQFGKQIESKILNN